MPEEAERLKRHYCGCDFKNCARFKVHAATGIKYPTLFPDENDKVKDIISALNHARAAKTGHY